MAQKEISRQRDRALDREEAKKLASVAWLKLVAERKAARSARIAAKPPVKRTPEQIERSRRRNEAQEANVCTRKIGKRGEAGRRSVWQTVRGGIEYSYHVTKGHRAVREPQGFRIEVGSMPPVTFDRDVAGHKAAAQAKRDRKRAARLAA